MWTNCSIGDLVSRGEAELKTGPFGTQMHASDYVEDGTPVINVRNIGYGLVRTEKLEYISDETVQRLSSHLLREGDIVFGRKGAVDRHVFIRPAQVNWFQGSDCLRLRLNSSKLDNVYASYQFLTEDHKQWMLNQCSHGATMASLNQDIICRIVLKLPPIDIQRRIASILSAYDDLIENNTRRIAILEEVARLIYQEWFVRFHFPGHDQVPMVESELGLIPEGWEVVPFTDLADVLSGGTPKKSEPEFWDGQIPFFTPKDASGTYYTLTTEANVTERGLAKCNSRLYPKDTVFITARGTVGKVVLPAVPMAMNQSCYALRGKDGIGQYFLFMATREAVDVLKARSHGACFSTIIVDTFRLLNVIRPAIALANAYEAQVTPIFQMVLNLSLKNANLRAQRDLLLPKLISGEIDVSQLALPTAESEAA